MSQPGRNTDCPTCHGSRHVLVWTRGGYERVRPCDGAAHLLTTEEPPHPDSIEGRRRGLIGASKFIKAPPINTKARRKR